MNSLITILNFETGCVITYPINKIKIGNAYEYYESFIINKGHNIKSCDWMIHDSFPIVESF